MTQKTEDFTRDPLNKGALVNTNNESLRQYKLMKKRMEDVNKISKLESRLDRIESLLTKLTENLNK